MRKHSLRLFIISAAALAVFAVAAIAVSVALTGKAVDDGLVSVADFVENACLGGADIDDIVEYADEGAPDMRITFIAKDGAVIADSSPWNSDENHLGRPEVEDALSKGEGFAERRSDTDGGNMNYYARLIELPGYGEVVLRVATPGSATKDVLAAMIPTCVVLIVAIALSMYLVDRYYNKSVMVDIDELKRQLHTINTGEFKKLSLDKSNSDILPYVNELNEVAETVNSLNKVRSEFFANASHELNTPLTYIGGYAELMEKGMLTDGAKIRECGEKIGRQTERMKGLIADMLKLSRLENLSSDLEKEKVDVAALLGAVADTFRLDAASKGVEINVYSSVGEVTSNERLLKEIAINLVQNAVKYNREGGRVDIFARIVGKTLEIKVADTGIGIAPEHHDLVFKRFYRVDKARSRSSGGTGLGLAIVKHAAQRLSGTVRLESKEGQGSTFIVEIPI